MRRACALALLAARDAVCRDRGAGRRGSGWPRRIPEMEAMAARADRGRRRSRPRHRRRARGRGGLPRRLRSARGGQGRAPSTRTPCSRSPRCRSRCPPRWWRSSSARSWSRWDSRMAELNPRFALHDPYPTAEVTLRDLFAHRSGLPGTSGDDLEAIGYDRDTIMVRLRLVPPVVELPRRLRLQQRRADPGRRWRRRWRPARTGRRWPRSGCSARSAWPRPATATRLPGAREPGGAARQARRRLGGAGARATPTRRRRRAASAPRCGTWPNGCGWSSPAASMAARRSLPRTRSPPRTCR